LVFSCHIYREALTKLHNAQEEEKDNYRNLWSISVIRYPSSASQMNP